MRTVLMMAVLLTAPAAAATTVDLIPGTYTNEEDVYFAKEAGKAPPVATAVRITREPGGVRLQAIDAFGKALETGHLMTITSGPTLNAGPCIMPFHAKGNALIADARKGTCHNESVMTRFGPEGISLSWPDGKTSLLRRARPVTCWGSVPKTAKKADGTDDWVFVLGLKLHDQGGRAQFGGGDTGVPPVIIRMRNVVWPTGPNKPSLVLYVHKSENPDHAESYSWADPGAKRIGINLRWMQASCSID